MQRIRWGVDSALNGRASKVMSEDDQIRCLRISSVAAVERPYARKVMSGWTVGGVGGDGGAILASGSSEPLFLAISSKAFLRRPIIMSPCS